MYYWLQSKIEYSLVPFIVFIRTGGSSNRVLEFNLDFATLSSRQPEYWHCLVDLKQLVFRKNNIEITGGYSTCYYNYKEDTILSKISVEISQRFSPHR